jgi:hypothetical protein
MTRNTARPHLEGRNHRIWMARANGASPTAIAEAFEMSVPNVYAILKQVAATIPDAERSTTAKMRETYLDRLREKALMVADLPPKKRYAPNGKELDGEDYGEVLAAIDRVIKIDERLARLTGTDNAIQYSVGVSAEAQQATKDAAEKVLQQFPTVAGVVPAGSG